MKNIEDIAFVIQARLGSQRVPQKMIKDFSGTTLMHVSLDKINSCSFIPNSQFFTSVFEDELKSICVQKGVNIFNRSEDSANSEGTPMSLMYEWWNTPQILCSYKRMRSVSQGRYHRKLH